MAGRRELNSGEYRRLRTYNWLFTIGAAVVALTLVFTVWFSGFRIDDDSMAPTLSSGNVVLVDRLTKYFSSPSRGELVVFDRGDGIDNFVGRVIALPGETVGVSGGRIYIDGQYLSEGDYASGTCPDMADLKLDEGSYFILPDARDGADMTHERVVVNAERLMGRIAVRVAPLGELTLYAG